MPSSKPPSLPPWKKTTPKSGKASARLAPAARAAAEARAKAAGRRYPNLIDNLWAARQRFETDGADDFPPDPPVPS